MRQNKTFEDVTVATEALRGQVIFIFSGDHFSKC